MFGTGLRHSKLIKMHCLFHMVEKKKDQNSTENDKDRGKDKKMKRGNGSSFIPRVFSRVPSVQV